MICVRTFGCDWRTNSAFAGQSAEHVDHNVLGGNACTNGAVPKYRNSQTAKKPIKTARSSPFSIRPCGNASSSHTTHGDISHVVRRPIVNGTLASEVVSAVNDHRNPMPRSATPNDLLAGSRSA